jgi:hypothetical protein
MPPAENPPKRRRPHVQWLIFAATFAYAVIAFYEWRGQINALKVDQRAWVGVDKAMTAEVIDLSASPYKIHSAVSLKNFGKTPAFDVTVQIWSGPEDQLDVNSNLQCKVAEGISSGKIPRDSSAHAEAGWPTFGKTIFPGEQVSEPTNLSGGTAQKFFIVGCIAYRDAFQIRHRTRFCYRSPQNLENDALKNGDVFAPCNRYNDAD